MIENKVIVGKYSYSSDFCIGLWLENPKDMQKLLDKIFKIWTSDRYYFCYTSDNWFQFNIMNQKILKLIYKKVDTKFDNVSHTRDRKIIYSYFINKLNGKVEYNVK